MELKIHKFKITGIFPLLTHNPAGMKPAGGINTKRIPTPEEEALAACYLDGEGNLGIPSIAFRSALLNGLKNKKIGKVSAISHFQAVVFNVDEFCTLINVKTGKPFNEPPVSVEQGKKKPDHAPIIDTRRAVVQRNGVLRSRPRFENWGCSLFLQIDEDRVSPADVARELDTAGKIVGVGDYRIERKGIFGTFNAVLDD